MDFVFLTNELEILIVTTSARKYREVVSANN